MRYLEGMKFSKLWTESTYIWLKWQIIIIAINVDKWTYGHMRPGTRDTGTRDWLNEYSNKLL